MPPRVWPSYGFWKFEPIALTIVADRAYLPARWLRTLPGAEPAIALTQMWKRQAGVEPAADRGLGELGGPPLIGLLPVS